MTTAASEWSAPGKVVRIHYYDREPEAVSANPHEARARRRKVERLIGALNHMAAINDTPRAVLAGMLRASDTAWWHQLASDAGVRPPSEATIIMTCNVYAERNAT